MLHRINSLAEVCDILGTDRPDTMGLSGCGWAELRSEDGTLLELCAFENLITDVGDRYYAERATGIGSPPGQVTGMRLGTGSTVPSKTGAGAAIVTYAGAGVSASKAIDGTYPQSSQPGGGGTARVITWVTSWAAGLVTVNGLGEVVLTNEASLTDVSGNAGNTIARALLAPVINKASSDTLTVTWTHNVLGS